MNNSLTQSLPFRGLLLRQFLFILFTTSFLLAYSQSPVPVCSSPNFHMQLPVAPGQKINLKEVQTLPGGDYLLAGNMYSNILGNQGLLMRMNPTGTLISQRQIRINNQEIELSNMKVLLSGKINIAGIFRDGTNNVFLAQLNNDLSTNWLKIFSLPSAPSKLTLDLFDTTSITLAVQLSSSIIFSAITNNGLVNWTNEVNVNGLTELVGFNEMNWAPLLLVSNCIRNGKKTIEMIELNKITGAIVSTHTRDNGTEESKGLETTCFNASLKLLSVFKTSSNQFKLERSISYTSAENQTRHNYVLPVNLDFTISGAMDNAGDVMGISLPQEGKLIFIKQFADYQTEVEYTRQYSVPAGSSIAAVSRSVDGGYLFGLNSPDSNQLVFIKTDSIGILAGCGFIDLANNVTENIGVGNFISSSTSSAQSLPVQSGPVSFTTTNFSPQYICNQNYCPLPPVEDSCLTSFYKTFRSHSYSDRFSEYHLMRNNQHFVSTYKLDRILGTSLQVSTGLKTFTEKGVFKKGVNLFQNGRAATMLTWKMTDSTVMVISYSNPGGIIHFTFTLMSDELEVIWSKTVKTYQGYEFTSSGLFNPGFHRDVEGNYYFIGASLGFMVQPALLVYKMNSNGDPLWLKAYQVSSTNILFGTVCATSSNSSLLVFVEGSGQGSVSVRLDKATGNLQNSYRYQSTWGGSGYRRMAEFYHDRIIYAGGTSVQSQFLMASFDTLGRPIKMKYILNSGSIEAGILKSGKLYASFRYYVNQSLKEIIFKADTALNIEFLNQYNPIKYGVPKGIGVDDQGFIYTGGNFSHLGVNSNYVDPYLVKYTSQGELGTCSFTTNPPVINSMNPQSDAISFVPIQRSFEQVSVPIDFVIETDGPQVSEILCSSSSGCNSIDIDGPQAVCNLNQDYTYSTTTNPGCNLIPQWITDTAFVIVQQTSNTNAVFRFKKRGSTWLKAKLNTGCISYTDSIQVFIFDSPSQFGLGADTSICPGNTLMLKAGKGFLSYIWQNGTTDSNFLVSSPGLYFVEVLDSCGILRRDSITINPSPPISFSPLVDRIKCNQDTIHFRAEDGFINYSWSPDYNMNNPGFQEIVVNPTTDTVYFLRAEKTPGCFIYDTVRINVYSSPVINLGNDTSFCQGGTVLLKAPSGFMAYYWNTTETTPEINANSAGNYFIIATTPEGCKSSDTMSILNVFARPIVNLDQKTELCSGSSKLLDAGIFAEYLWQDGSTGRNLTVNNTGTYYVQVKDIHGCNGSDTSYINTILPLPKNFLPADTAICSYETLELKPVRTYNFYTWNTNTNSPVLKITFPGNYWLEVTDDKNCKGRDSIIVAQKDCLKGFHVPDAFTPNNDGKNDIFRALVFGPTRSFSFTVYNRWGQIVFFTTNPQEGWNGKYLGLEQKTQAFVWTCVYQFENEAKKMEKGTVLLIR